MNDIWKKVGVGDPDDCWHFLGHTNAKGYGQLWLFGRLRKCLLILVVACIFEESSSLTRIYAQLARVCLLDQIEHGRDTH